MALTLTEGNKYSTTELDRAVIDQLVKDSRVLELLPFESLIGNSLTYDTIVTDSSASFFSVNETWTESTPSMSQATVTLKILGQDADIDNFLLDTRSNKIDMKGTILANKIKAVQYKFLDTFYYGDATANTKEFKGLQLLMTSTSYNTVHAGATAGSSGGVKLLRQAIDLITGYKGEKVVMSKKVRRDLAQYLDSVGSAFPASRDEFGRTILTFDGMEVVVEDHINDVETASSGAYSSKTGSDTSTVFVMTFAPQAICGVQGSKGVTTEPLGSLETKDAQRYRIKWYCGLKYEDLRSASKLDGIHTAVAWTAAGGT